MSVWLCFRRHFETRMNRLALAGYALLTALFYAPELTGLGTFPSGDFTEHFLSFSLFQRSELLAGRLPLWNPYTYAGHPFLADTQSAVFYPISNLIPVLTMRWASIPARLYWLQVEAILHIALAGFFTYLLVQELTGQRGPAFLAGCAFAFSGYLTGYPPLQLAILRTAIWLPLLMWTLWHAFAHPDRGWWWIISAVVYAVAFLAGHSQTFLFLTYVVAAWIGLLFLSRWHQTRMSRHILRDLRGLAVFCLLFLGLCAAQALPSLEFMRLSTRASVSYDFVKGGFPIQDTWQMLLPKVLTIFSPLYNGVVGLGLAIFAVVWLVTKGRSTRQTTVDSVPPGSVLAAFFGGISVFFLIASYGGHSFLYPLLYRWAPGWNLFRGQERAAYIVSFGVSVLAGYGAALLGGSMARLRRVVAGSLVVAVAGGILAFALFWQRAGRGAATWAAFGMSAGVAMLGTVLLAVLMWTDRATRWRQPLLVMMIVSDLLWANGKTNLDKVDLTRKAMLPVEAIALQQAMQDSLAWQQGMPGRAFNEYRIYPDYGMQAQVEDILGSSPLLLARFERLLIDFPLDRLWRLTGVTHVLTWRRELFEPSSVLAEFPQGKDTTYLHRLSEPNPRAWVVQTVQMADDAEALRLLADHGFDLETCAVLAPDAASKFAEAQQRIVLAATGHNELHVERVEPQRIRITYQSDHGGLVVVAENWMPGWRASVTPQDGQEQIVPVQRTNLTFLGVMIPAGVGTVSLTYCPASVQCGLFISAVTCVLIVTGIACWWYKRRSVGQKPIAF